MLISWFQAFAFGCHLYRYTTGEAGSIQAAEKKQYNHSASLIPRLASKWPKPEWHAPWKLYRVISGHQGWVRSVTVDPSNEWFVTVGALYRL
jgi:pleiotropic regulator 1